jgi:alpha-amylase
MTFKIYLDAVLNHKAGADELDTCLAREVDPEDRNKMLTDPYSILNLYSF